MGQVLEECACEAHGQFVQGQDQHRRIREKRGVWCELGDITRSHGWQRLQLLIQFGFDLPREVGDLVAVFNDPEPPGGCWLLPITASNGDGIGSM